MAKLDALEDQGDRRFGGTGLGSELQAYIEKLDKQEPIERSNFWPINWNTSWFMQTINWSWGGS